MNHHPDHYHQQQVCTYTGNGLLQQLVKTTNTSRTTVKCTSVNTTGAAVEGSTIQMTVLTLNFASVVVVTYLDQVNPMLVCKLIPQTGCSDVVNALESH